MYKNEELQMKAKSKAHTRVHTGPIHRMKRKAIFICLEMLVIFSLLLQYSPQINAAEPEITSQDSELSVATWYFNNEDDFNTSEIVIAYSEASLKSHDYYWNQSSKTDFNKGEQNEITIKQEPESTKTKYYDNFLFDQGWTHGIIEGGPDQWERGSPSGESSFILQRSGTPVWGTNLSGKYDDEGEADDIFLESPTINLSQSENTEMSFWHYYIFEDEKDGGVVEVSTDNGGTWLRISPDGGYDKPIDSFQNPLDGEYAFTGNSNGWVYDEFNLHSFDGYPTFLIRFRFATDGLDSDFGWYIDEIEITSTTFTDGEVELAIKNIEIGNSGSNPILMDVNRTFIDFNNPVKSDGILTEWTVHTATEGTGKMKIFRDEGGSEFKFINETDLKYTAPGGENTYECYIEVKAGDYIGWYSKTANIRGDSEGGASFMEGDIFWDTPQLSWTSDSISLSISSKGIHRYYTGTLISQVFDDGSSARWDKLSWSENTSHPAVDISFKTRTGDTNDPDDGFWNLWSSEMTNPVGSTINSPNSRYIQFQAILTTAKQPFTPTLFDVSISYNKYSPLGEIETRDFIPEDIVVQWGEFSTSEELSGQQNIYYNYSLDSGDTWQPVPENFNLSSVSVLKGKIRFKATLSTVDTTSSPVLDEMSLEYSSATPEMDLFIQPDKKTVRPGEVISFEIVYSNTGIGDAKDVSITFVMDANLTYKGDTSSVESTREGENTRKWRLDLVEPASKSFFVDAKVNGVEEESTISVYALLNYTDIGGNSYPGVMSGTVSVEVKIEEDLLPYYLLIGALIAIITATLLFFIIMRLRAEEGEERIAMEDVERGIGYLVMEENPKRSYTLFSDFIDEGNSGLCITRTYPERVKSDYYFEGVSILWLSRRGDTDSILPTNLGAVVSNVKEFMKNNEGSVILLDGLEYLIVHNDFEKVLKLVHALNELTAINKSILLIPVNFKTLDEEKIALLKRDLKMLG